MELGTNSIAPEPISTTYRINPFHHSMSLYAHPLFVARHRLIIRFTKTTNTSARVRVTLRLTVSRSVSQYVLMSSPLCGRLTRYCFLFKSLGQEFVVLSLWGALSDERPDLSFVKSQSRHLSVCTLTIYIFVFHTFIYIHTLYNTYNIYKASLCNRGIEMYFLVL
jgi:hypothetical protein